MRNNACIKPFKMSENKNVATATAQTEAKQLTSEKLEQLKKQYAEAWQKMAQFNDPFSKEAKDAKLAAWKIEGEMKAEEAALVKAANDAKIAEARNQRLQLNKTQLDAFEALLVAKADKKADPAKVAELQTAFDTAREAVENELLAKYATSKPAKVSADGDKPASEKGKDSAAIVDLFLQGKTHKEIEAAGYARSTVWHAINNYKKANGLS